MSLEYAKVPDLCKCYCTQCRYIEDPIGFVTAGMEVEPNDPKQVNTLCYKF